MEVSTDPARLDVGRIHHWLSTDAYWALGRTREVVERSIANSLNVGAYEADGGEQVGYARVVTDHATFAWLCDVYVDPGRRGQGVGVALVEAVLAELAGDRLRRVMLATQDAHGLYARYGFEPLADPGIYLTRGGPQG
jgi:GNAT superfamily N-acetyltransferase